MHFLKNCHQHLPAECKESYIQPITTNTKLIFLKMSDISQDATAKLFERFTMNYDEIFDMLLPPSTFDSANKESLTFCAKTPL